MAVISYVNQSMPGAVTAPAVAPPRLLGTPMAPTPSKPKPLGLPSHLNGDGEATPRSSVAGSPPPEDMGTPQPAGEDANGDDVGDLKASQPDTDIMDRTVPVMPLDQAILTSIQFASTASNGTVDDRRRRDLLGSIMLIGGASRTENLGAYLETKLREAMPQYPKEILVAPPPRELDPDILVWKGGSIFGKLRMTNDSWIGKLEYDRLGTRILNYKAMWHW